ncbi:hypothetical protein DM01DRAFT_1383482 [Hesseltinella vesiculosa]|uniref:CBS domain-containing protein n=1 Tax=Hesseltinella vesiculosa TaxID=101127 RepID=A0A1X2GHZ5_9FUNG|nr:hypothetical protein DM01DRAFT_1383482 [Hesseltinella vesiculosa]
MATLQQTATPPLGQRRRSTHRTFIETKTVGNVINKVKPPSERYLVDLPITASVEQAFDVLLAEEILSLPVYRLDNNVKTYLTIISVLDLLKLYSRHKMDALPSDFFQHQLQEAMGNTDESSHLVTVSRSDGLKQVLSLFTEHGAHRVLVQPENEGDAPVLLSQMDLVRYFQAHNHHLGPILDATVPSLVVNGQRLHKPQSMESITFKTKATDAFDQLARHPTINAVPIVDDDEVLVGDLSPEDLRGLNKERLQQLDRPVLMFLRDSHGELYPPFTCHARFTLSQLMASIVLRNAHRLWWVDVEGHVQGIITLTDVLGAFINDA